MKWLSFGFRVRDEDKAENLMADIPPEVREFYRAQTSRAKKIRCITRVLMILTCGLLVTISAGSAGLLLYPNIPDTFFRQSFTDARRAQSINHPLEHPSLNDIVINTRTGTSVAVGNDGLILRTEDEGRSWTQVDSGTRDDLNAIAFSKDSDTALVGGNGGVVLFSTDDGQSWQRPEDATHTNKAFNDVALSSDGRIAAAVGRKGLIRISSDHGDSWIDPGNVTAKDLNAVVLSRDGKTVVVAGDDETIRVAATEQAKDREKWIPGKVNDDSGKKPRSDFEALALGGKEGETVVAVGDDGLIWSSTDPEMKWENWNSHDEKKRSDDFKAVAFSGNGSTAMAVGPRGHTWVFRDSGQKWVPEKNKVGDRLEAISLSDDGKIAVAVGRDGAIVVSTDKGSDWTSPASQTAKRLYAVALSGDGKWATAVGRDATLLRLSSIGQGQRPEVALTTFAAVFETAPETLPPPEPQAPSDLDSTEVFRLSFYYKSLMWPIGSVFILMFMVRYLILLTKYYLRLSGFYYARGDAILLCDSKTLPRPATIDELEQLIRALSPEELEFDRTPRSLMKQALGMVRYSFRERKPSKTQPGDG